MEPNVLDLDEVGLGVLALVMSFQCRVSSHVFRLSQHVRTNLLNESTMALFLPYVIHL